MIKSFKDYISQNFLGIIIFSCGIIPILIIEPTLIFVSLFILLITYSTHLLEEYYNKYYILNRRVSAIIDDKIFSPHIQKNEYNKFIEMKINLNKNFIHFTLNPFKIKKGIEKIYENYGHLVELKEESREFKLKQILKKS